MRVNLCSCSRNPTFNCQYFQTIKNTDIWLVMCRYFGFGFLLLLNVKQITFFFVISLCQPIWYFRVINRMSFSFNIFIYLFECPSIYSSWNRKCYTTKLQFRGIRLKNILFFIMFLRIFFDWIFFSKTSWQKLWSWSQFFYFNMPLTANNNNKTTRDWSSFKNLSNFYVSRPVNKKNKI